MKVYCAWCGEYMGEKEPFEDTGVTHGMCQECQKRLIEKEGKESDD